MNHSEKKALEFVTKHRLKFYSVGVLLLFFILSIGSHYAYDAITKGSSTYGDDSGYAESDTSSCNVLGINLHGDLYTYIPESNDDELMSDKDVVGSEEIMSALISADEDEAIKAVIIEVDSSGGYPVAGEEIAKTIQSISKPVVAFIRQSGTSAAYWSIITADKIFASKNSDVGSIGVTISYLENVAKNEKDGVKYVQLSAGKYKDAGSPDKLLTEEEKAIIVRDLKIVHENFIQDIADSRNIPIDKVRSIADGSSVLGEKAKELGLIDEIGGFLDVKKYVEEKIGEKADVCW